MPSFRALPIAQMIFKQDLTRSCCGFATLVRTNKVVRNKLDAMPSHGRWPFPDDGNVLRPRLTFDEAYIHLLL